jgi:DNA-binding FrmR family transcriptional regulator
MQLRAKEPMSQEVRGAVIPRMRSAKGHLGGILRMLEDPTVDTQDVLKQLGAVRGALRIISALVLSGHVHEQVSAAVHHGNAEQVTENVMEAVKYRC